MRALAAAALDHCRLKTDFSSSERCYSFSLQNYRLLLHCGATWQTHRTASLRGCPPRFMTKGPLTIPAIRYGHNSGTAVKLEPTSVNLRIRRAQTINTVPRQVNANETNVWSPK
jgi:hypothetical protein